MADEHADAAGIDAGDILEIEDDTILILAEEFDHGGIEAIEGRAHSEASLELDDLHTIDSLGLNVQVLTPWRSASSAAVPIVDTQKGLCYSSRTS